MFLRNFVFRRARLSKQDKQRGKERSRNGFHSGFLNRSSLNVN
jgi:hypothetical protein